MNTDRILSVAEFNRLVSDYLEQGLGTMVVQGEVSGFRIARDRLVYFELKDENARCLCFAMKWEIDQPLEDGMEVKVTGTPKIFQSTGGFHLRVQAVELVGAGSLQKAFEKLKKKLEAEGLFDAHGIHLADFPTKSDGLRSYIARLQKQSRKVFGGIVANTDPRRFTGQWMVYNGNSKEAREGEWENWERLEL